MKQQSAPEKVEVEVEVDGQVHTGYRIVEGSRRLDQFIFYKGLCFTDLKSYPPEQRDTVMLTQARMAIAEAVSGRSLGFSQIPSRFRKVIENIDN